MTVSQHGAPNSPYGQGTNMTPGGPPAHPVGPPGHEWRYAPQASRGNKLVTAGIVFTALVALAALVVGIIALTTRPAPTPASAPAPTAPVTTTTAAGDTSAADRAMCSAIAPLMAESDRISNAWTDAGEPGTPPRDAATPKFISDSLNWIGRTQPILDQHPEADPFFRRSLQRFIDDLHLLVVDLTPGPLTSYAKALYNDAVGAYSGPLHICDGFGIKW